MGPEESDATPAGGPQLRPPRSCRGPEYFRGHPAFHLDEYGNIRSEEHGYMNGGDVFTFVNREVPRDIKNMLEYTQRDKDSFDYLVFHQANNFINTHVAKKLKLDTSKIPSTIEKYGNTSSVSVPLTIVSELKDKMAGEKSLLLSAFGVGMTWATAVVPFVDLKISEIVEV